jgi:hypothetical protein
MRQPTTAEVRLDGGNALPFLNQTEQRATLIELVLSHAPWEEV